MILAIICSNTYALIISNGRVLSHKEWADQNIVATISDVNFHQTASMVSAAHHEALGFATKTNEAIGISNMIDEGNGVVNQKTKLTGGIKTYIENFTKETHVYTVKSMMCADVNRSCLYTLDTIELAPGGKIQSRKSIQLAHIYKNIGKSLIYIATWVKRDKSSTMSQTDNVNTVNIIKS